MFKPKLYLVTTILGMLALVAGACAQPAPTPAPTPTLTGTLKLLVTDAPPGEDVTSIMVTVREVQVHKALAEQEKEREREQSSSGNQTQEQERERQQTQQGEGAWISIALSDNMTTFDLLEIRGIEQFLGTSEIEATKYTQVRLVVDTVQVKLGSGELQDATVPSKELKIVHPFNVVGGETTALVIDFDADKMVTVTGAGKIIVKPVVKLTVRQEKSTKRAGSPNTEPQASTQASVEVYCDDFINAQHISKEIEVTVGDKFAVTLCSNPTTGFKWGLVEITDQNTLELVDSKHEAGEKAKQEPPVLGAGDEEIWTFKALKEGESIISMEYSQPWEGGDKAVWTLVLTVNIK